MCVFINDSCKASLLCQGKYFSTFFSGCGTVERGVRLLQIALRQYGIDFNPTPVATLDWAKDCQRCLGSLLTQHGHMHAHVFRNAFDVVKARNSDWRETWSYDRKCTEINKLKLATHAFCVRHNKMCPLQRCDWDMSGSPCTPYSQTGLGLGIEDPVNTALISYGRFHTGMRTPMCIHENVCPFPWQRVLPCHLPHQSVRVPIQVIAITKSRNLLC